MKKVLSLIFILTFLLVGCNNPTVENSEIENSTVESSDKSDKDLLDVIDNKIPFVDANNNEVFLKDYKISEYDNYDFSPFEYASVDFDGDKTNELVILETQQNFYLILRYDEAKNKIYGYHADVRSLIDLKTDGTFMQSSGAGINSISKLNFENGEIVFTELALKNDFDKEYKINKDDAQPEDVNSFFDEWNAVPKVSWISIK